MKNIPASLASYLPSTKKLIMAGCFEFDLMSGTVYRATDFQADLVIASPGGGSVTYAGGGAGAGNLGISGLKLTQKIGLDADEQQVVLSWRPIGDPYGPSTIGGLPFVQAFRYGLFDKAEFIWGVATLAAFPVGAAAIQPIGWGATCPDGTVFGGVATLFKGRVAQVKSLGAIGATLTIKSDLVALEQDMPHRVFQPSCVHTLYDGGCTLSVGPFTTAGSVGAGSTNSLIMWSGSVQDTYTNGTITFTSGANAGVTATVKYSSSTYLQLAYPLDAAPAAGDSFSVSMGCDKTLATCKSRFGNQAHYLGFPFIPPPESAV
jgi:hypothetical protein